MSILSGKQDYEPSLKDTVIVKTKQGRLQGIIQYVGQLNGGSKTLRYGIELNKAMGDHNGTYKGYQYFKCDKNYGILVKRASILKKIKSAQSTSQRKIGNIVQKPIKIENKTFNRMEKIILSLMRITMSSNTALIDNNIVLLIYIYCDPYNFKFIKECTENTFGEITIHHKGLGLRYIYHISF